MAHEQIPREVSIRQWFHTALSEKEGQALVGHIQGTKRYGLLVPYNDLPEQAKELVRAEYDRTVIPVSEPESHLEFIRRTGAH